MPTVNPDYSEALAPLTPGIYLCRIVSCEFKTSQNDNRYINWKLETVQDKRTVYYTTMVEGRAAGMLKHFIRCVLDPSYENGPFDTDHMIGKIVTMHLNVKEVESKGKMTKVFEVKEVERTPIEMKEEDLPF
jgi:hypothetical protein